MWDHLLCYGLNVLPPKFKCGSPSPQRDGVWVWGLWGRNPHERDQCPYKKRREMFSPAMWEYSKKAVIWKPGREPQEPKHCHSDLQLPASRTVRNNFFLFKPPMPSCYSSPDRVRHTPENFSWTLWCCMPLCSCDSSLLLSRLVHESSSFFLNKDTHFSP